MDDSIFGLVYTLAWGLISLVGVVLMFLLYSYLYDRYETKIVGYLNLTVVPLVIVWLWFVGVRVNYFAHTHVYVTEDVVVVTIREDDIVTLYNEPGFHRVPEFDQSIVWQMAKVRTLEVTERSNVFDSGNIIVIATFDFTNIEPVKVYKDFECGSNSCLLLIMFSDIRSSYQHDGCSSVIDSLKKFEKYGVVVTKISYCR